MERVDAHKHKGQHKIVDQAANIVPRCDVLVELDFLETTIRLPIHFSYYCFSDRMMIQFIYLYQVELWQVLLLILVDSAEGLGG